MGLARPPWRWNEARVLRAGIGCRLSGQPQTAKRALHRLPWRRLGWICPLNKTIERETCQPCSGHCDVSVADCVRGPSSPTKVYTFVSSSYSSASFPSYLSVAHATSILYRGVIILSVLYICTATSARLHLSSTPQLITTACKLSVLPQHITPA